MDSTRHDPKEATDENRSLHYDGAKDEDTVIQIWGIGPAASTPAEKR
jgi:hypothetical protein